MNSFNAVFINFTLILINYINLKNFLNEVFKKIINILEIICLNFTKNLNKFKLNNFEIYCNFLF